MPEIGTRMADRVIPLEVGVVAEDLCLHIRRCGFGLPELLWLVAERWQLLMEIDPDGRR